MKPEAIIREAHAQFDRRWEKCCREKAAEPSTCRSGCHACCSEPLLVNREEAKLCYKSIPPGKRDGVRERARVWLERAAASGMLQVKTPLAWDYLAAKLVCPLLENGLCLVYENRPLGCRSHNAIGDPALCHSPEGRRTQKYFYSPELTEQLALMTCGASPEAAPLGVYLSRWLLGVKVESAAEVTFPVKFEGVTADGVMQLRYL